MLKGLCYERMNIEKRKKIALFSKYSRNGASSRIRTMQYIPYIQENGGTIDIYSLFDERYLKQLYKRDWKAKLRIPHCYIKRIINIISVCLSKEYDIIWLEKEFFPWVPWWIEKIFYQANKPIIVDYDDAIFTKYEKSRNMIARLIMKNKIRMVNRRAELVIAGNKYLKEFARLSGAKRIKIIRL